MRCAICGHAVQPDVERVVLTTMGEFVHVNCADLEAQRAYRRRTWRAAVSAGVGIGLLALAVRIENSDVVLLALLILAVAHTRLNERWWHLTILPRRRRWH